MWRLLVTAHAQIVTKLQIIANLRQILFGLRSIRIFVPALLLNEPDVVVQIRFAHHEDILNEPGIALQIRFVFRSCRR